MHYSGVFITLAITLSTLLAKTHNQPNYDLKHRSVSPSRNRRSLSATQLLSSINSSKDISSNYGTTTTTSYSNVAQSTSSDDCYKTTAAAAPTTLATSQPIPTIPTTCDITQPKFAINNLLVTYNDQLGKISDSITTLTNQVNANSVQQVGSLIAVELQKTITILTTCLSTVQKCGMDPKPLSSNKGTNLSDVSWSAFQIVLTLKTVFESVSCLYKPFPAIRQTCSDILLKLSTALASLIGACGEQLNLFDTRFFPLVTPQLKEFTDIEDNFSSFFGSFVA